MFGKCSEGGAGLRLGFALSGRVGGQLCPLRAERGQAACPTRERGRVRGGYGAGGGQQSGHGGRKGQGTPQSRLPRALRAPTSCFMCDVCISATPALPEKSQEPERPNLGDGSGMGSGSAREGGFTVNGVGGGEDKARGCVSAQGLGRPSGRTFRAGRP